MPLFSRHITVLVCLLILTISCGESNNQQESEISKINVNEKNLCSYGDFETDEDLAILTENTDPSNLSIDHTKAFSGDYSLKITNNNDCLTMIVLNDIPVLKNQSYLISFAIQRNENSYDLEECDTFKSLSTSKQSPKSDERESKAGVSIFVDDITISSGGSSSDYNGGSSGLWVDVYQDNQNIAKTSGDIINSDSWATITAIITTVNESPLSISLKTNYETLWIDDVEIKQAH